jgi:pimeloyl-ACP methyl ester carboxylesterase
VNSLWLPEQELQPAGDEMALASWMLLANGPQPEEQSFFIDGHRMHCLVAGRGPKTILVHGLLGSADAWAPCFSRMGEESELYAIDALGIGRSERVPGLDASLHAHVDRLVQWMELAEIERADFVGTSHGGAVVMMLAAKHPELVRSMVLHAPANPFSTIADPLVHFYRTSLGRWFAQQVPNLPEKLQEIALGRMYGDAKLMDRHGLDRYMSSLRVPGTVEHVLNILNCWFDDMRELEQALKSRQDIPTLFLWGTRDRAVSVASCRLLQEILPHAEMKMLPGVGHLPYEEAPALFSEAVNSFLRKQDRGRKGLQLVQPGI